MIDERQALKQCIEITEIKKIFGNAKLFTDYEKQFDEEKMVKLQAILCCCALLGLSAKSHAVPIVQTAQCVNDVTKICAIGIENIEIMDMLFDVTFTVGSYNNLFAINDPFFLGNLVGAQLASSMISVVLNSTPQIAGALG